MSDLDELLRPPSEAEAAAALAAFAARVRSAYGERLRGLYLFGSRARSDHRPDSDADVAAVLADGTWRPWDETKRLIGMAFSNGLDHTLYIQPWAFSEREWANPDRSSSSDLLRSAQRDARPLG